jgi:DNA-directed RNA polymerase specialized sigma24 family protein
MSTPGSVTTWVKVLRDGDQEAAAQLWERYFNRLSGYVRAMFGQARSGVADENDVAISAFHSFCRRVEDNHYENLRDRDDLWRILVVIARAKAIDWFRYENAAKRKSGSPQGDVFLEEVVSPEPTPQFMAELLDEIRHLVDLLRGEDSTLSLIALRKFEGYSSAEIAAELSRNVRTVERKVERIRALWMADAESRAAKRPQ